MHKMEKKKYNLFVEGDYNDGDYTSVTHRLNLDIKEVESLVSLFKNIEKHGWNNSESSRDKNSKELYVESGLLTIEQHNIIEDYMPFSEHGIHTLIDVHLTEVSNIIKLY